MYTEWVTCRHRYTRITRYPFFVTFHQQRLHTTIVQNTRPTLRQRWKKSVLTPQFRSNAILNNIVHKSYTDSKCWTWRLLLNARHIMHVVYKSRCEIKTSHAGTYMPHNNIINNIYCYHYYYYRDTGGGVGYSLDI